MKKVVSILMFLGMGAFVSAQLMKIPPKLKLCSEIKNAEYTWTVDDEGTICRAEYTANGKGWNRSDFEPYLRKYTIRYGNPIYENTSQGHDMIWCWEVEKKYILNLRYLMYNSLAPAKILVYVTEK